MRLSNLFTVPTGQKITERHLRRVLISSICSILLCMSCLVGTTWAWFAVSIENTGNVIQIVERPEISVTVGEEGFVSGSELQTGTHTMYIEHANEVDDLQKKSTLYVTLNIEYGNGTITVYTTLDQDNQYKTEIEIDAGKPCVLSWDVSWFAPANATALTDSTITVTAEDPTEPSTEEAAETSEAATSEPSTETVTEPSIEVTTEPSEGDETDSAAESSRDDASEPSTEISTEPSTVPSSEPSTVPSTELM